MLIQCLIALENLSSTVPPIDEHQKIVLLNALFKGPVEQWPVCRKRTFEWSLTLTVFPYPAVPSTFDSTPPYVGRARSYTSLILLAEGAGRNQEKSGPVDHNLHINCLELKSGVFGSESLGSSAPGPPGYGCYKQRHCSVLYQQVGRNMVGTCRSESIPVDTLPGHSSQGKTHSALSQCDDHWFIPAVPTVLGSASLAILTALSELFGTVIDL